MAKLPTKKQIQKKKIILSAVAAAFVFLIIVFYMVMTRSGHWLVDDDEFDHVKWAVVLDGQSADMERIDLAAELGKPLIIHCVRTSQQVLRLWRDNPQAHHVAWVIHGFRGNENVARDLLEAGFYLSFGLKFNPQAVAITPLDRLLVETDDDATTSIDHVVQVMAQARGCSARSIKHHVRRNALRIIKYK